MINHEYVLKMLDYDPDTGIFRWKVSPGTRIDLVGKIAGRINKGRIQIKLKQRHYEAGQLAWFYVYGKWSENLIDHKNQNSLDNRISNLREANFSENCANKHTSNMHGYKGVYQRTDSKTTKYRATIIQNGKKFSLGTFPTAEQAHKAYMKAAIEKFGEFASP